MEFLFGVQVTIPKVQRFCNENTHGSDGLKIKSQDLSSAVGDRATCRVGLLERGGVG